MTLFDIQERRYKKFCIYRDTYGYRETWDMGLYKKYDVVIGLTASPPMEGGASLLDICRALFAFENWTPS